MARQAQRQGNICNASQRPYNSLAKKLTASQPRLGGGDGVKGENIGGEGLAVDAVEVESKEQP